eukprot:11205597-Lingulodinium_polyedra.AAC.1
MDDSLSRTTQEHAQHERIDALCHGPTRPTPLAPGPRLQQRIRQRRNPDCGSPRQKRPGRRATT